MRNTTNLDAPLSELVSTRRLRALSIGGRASNPAKQGHRPSHLLFLDNRMTLRCMASGVMLSMAK